ncbi:hypothetical protein BC829DRAFT_401176 [Chytridium lagenaria]|nr:hypothetical protein BC829DRAFT_401176 [Chytridium lagenaria]
MQLRWVNGIPPHKSKTEWAEFKHDLKFFETLPPITQYRLREAVTHILSVLKGDAATVISETDGDGEIFPTDYSHNSYFTATTLLDLLDHGLRFDANLVKVILTDFLDILRTAPTLSQHAARTIEIVRLLIDAGADVNAVFDSDAVPSECALETAAKRAFMTSVLKVEMTFPRVVEVAASRRDAESGILVEELLGRGPRVVALIKGLADKALEGDGAKYVEGMDAVRLLKFSSDPRLISMDLIDQCLAEEVFGRLCVVGEENAVVFALERKLIRVAKKIALEPSGERLRIDLKGGSLVVNMLHWASEVGCLEIVKALVESKIVEAEVGDQYAIRSACVKYLIGLEGVDPAYDDSLPLRQACAFGHTHIVSLLLRDGRADPSAYDSQAVDLALEHEHLTIVSHLPLLQPLIANHFESDSNRVTRQYLKTFAGFGGTRGWGGYLFDRTTCWCQNWKGGNFRRVLWDEEVEGVTALFGLMKASEMGDWEEGALKKLVPMGVLCRLSPMIFLAMTCVHFAEYGADVGVLVNGFLRGLDEEEVRAFEEVVGDAADAVESSDNGAEADGWRRRKMLRGFVEWVDDIIENAVVEGDEECVKDVLDIPSLSRRLDALRVRWLTAAIKKILTLRTISLPLLNQLLDPLPGSLLPVSATQSHEIFNLILSRLNRLPDVREGSLALIAASNAGCVEVVEMLVGRGMQEGWVDPGFNERFEEIVTVDEEKMKVHPFGEEIFDLF